MNSAPSLAAVSRRIAESARAATQAGVHDLTFAAMSTRCVVKVHDLPASTVRDFQREVIAWVAAFEARYSRFIPDSLVGRINAAAGEHWVEIDAETDRLLAFCADLVFLTRGAFDPTALPLMKLWNWKAQPPVVPDEEAVRRAQPLVGWNRIQRRAGAIFLPEKGMGIDLGGIGKEYAVDCVMNLALQRGIRNVLVDFGRDVRACGAPPGKRHWHIGLEDFQQPGRCWAGVAITNHAVASSSDNLRCFEVNGRRYGHIIDPRTGYPVDNGCRGASVIASTCTVAGVLSTSALILGPQAGLQLIESHQNAAGAVTIEGTRLYSRKFHEFIPH